MFGLEFSLAEAVNVATAGLIGAAVTLIVGWWTTRRLREHIYESFDRQARLLEAVGKGYQPRLKIDDDTDRVTGYKIRDKDVRNARSDKSAED